MTLSNVAKIRIPETGTILGILLAMMQLNLSNDADIIKREEMLKYIARKSNKV